MSALRSTDWLNAGVARDWLEEHLNCQTHEAEYGLLRRIIAGLPVRVARLEGECHSGFDSQDYSLCHSEEFPTGKSELDSWMKLLASEIISRRRNVDIRECWPTGDFSVSDVGGPSSQPTTIDVIGLQFNRAALILSFGIPEVLVAGASRSQSSSEVRRRPGPGRPAEYDWNGAFAHVAAVANGPDGLPEGHGAQAAIARIMADWFRYKRDNEPGDTELKRHANKILSAIDEVTHVKGGNPTR